ncbi:hypothetical protein O181_082138 [Austropuccinia psidii MF-1]|uniref:Uncharacterized protein n=1 Tax=Austropuccinia psidii MF-1 TaxID=1389203 RepID=A0A9Q3II68_9BASI|nr:hypothetical protein [Austropuccinia psidii MF-1]
MSSKLTELTESSPSVPPPSALCGSGILSQLASSGHFDPCQTYDGYKEVKVLHPACTEFSAKGRDFFQHFNPKSSKCHFCFVGKSPCCHPGPMASNIRRYFWSKKDGPFGKEFPVSKGPTPDGTSGYSDLTGSRQRDVARWTNIGRPIPVGGTPIYSISAAPISRINTEGVVTQIGRIADSPPDPDAEGSDELDASCLIPSTPRNFQPTLATIPTSLPPESPSSSHTRPDITPAVIPSPIQQSRAPPIVTSSQIQ